MPVPHIDRKLEDNLDELLKITLILFLTES